MNAIKERRKIRRTGIFIKLKDRMEVVADL